MTELYSNIFIGAIFIFSSAKYNIKISEDSYRLLKDFVRTKNVKDLIEMIKENMLLESMKI